MPAGGKVTVFGPHPMLAITVEALTSEGGDDIHLHAAGQGVWVARMAAELGAEPILCGFIGGESGAVLRSLLEQMEVEMRLIETAEASGAYVHDRRSGERVPFAQSASMPPSRHKIDELFSTTVAAALEGGPDLVKINDWELAGYIEGPVDTDERMRAAETLRVSAAAGAANFLRAGLGSGSRAVIENLARKVELWPLWGPIPARVPLNAPPLPG
jgi:fructose-1-phosphate kinase PfkB-like protein